MNRKGASIQVSVDSAAPNRPDEEREAGVLTRAELQKLGVVELFLVSRNHPNAHTQAIARKVFSQESNALLNKLSATELCALATNEGVNELAHTARQLWNKKRRATESALRVLDEETINRIAASHSDLIIRDFARVALAEITNFKAFLLSLSESDLPSLFKSCNKPYKRRLVQERMTSVGQSPQDRKNNRRLDRKAVTIIHKKRPAITSRKPSIVDDTPWWNIKETDWWRIQGE